MRRKHKKEMKAVEALAALKYDKLEEEHAVMKAAMEAVVARNEKLIGFHPRSPKMNYGSDSRQFSASVGISI